MEEPSQVENQNQGMAQEMEEMQPQLLLMQVPTTMITATQQLATLILKYAHIPSMHCLLSAIRNITADLTSVAFDPYQNNISASGAFSIGEELNYWNATGTNKRIISARNVEFKASRVISTTNEIRPYSIYALPLIAYQRESIDCIWAYFVSTSVSSHWIAIAIAIKIGVNCYRFIFCCCITSTCFCIGIAW